MNILQTPQTSRQSVIFNLNCFWSCRGSLKCSLWDARRALAVPEEEQGSFPFREAITQPPGLHHRDEFWARQRMPHPEQEPESSNSAAERSLKESKAPPSWWRERAKSGARSGLCGSPVAGGKHSCCLPVPGCCTSPPHMVLQSPGSVHGKQAGPWLGCYPKALEAAVLGELLWAVWCNPSVHREQARGSK